MNIEMVSTPRSRNQQSRRWSYWPSKSQVNGWPAHRDRLRTGQGRPVYSKLVQGDFIGQVRQCSHARSTDHFQGKDCLPASTRVRPGARTRSLNIPASTWSPSLDATGAVRHDWQRGENQRSTRVRDHLEQPDHPDRQLTMPRSEPPLMTLPETRRGPARRHW